MFNFIKKVFANYVNAEKQLSQIRCLIVDDGQRIRKVIKTLPKKQRRRAMQYTYELAFWGFSLERIIKELKERGALL